MLQYDQSQREPVYYRAETTILTFALVPNQRTKGSTPFKITLIVTKYLKALIFIHKNMLYKHLNIHCVIKGTHTNIRISDKTQKLHFFNKK